MSNTRLNSDLYIKKLNISELATGSTVTNLGIDANGFVVSGETADNFYTTGATLNGTVLEFDRNDLTNAYNVELSGLTSSFTGNTSGDCINDIFVSNIHSCSPLNINPLDEGNIYFGSTSGVTIDLNNNGNIYTKGDYVIQSEIDANLLIPFLMSGDNKGYAQLIQYTGNTGIYTINPSLSGSTGIFMGISSEKSGLIRYHGDSFSRNAPSAVNGDNFYQNKMLVSGGLNSNGLIIAGTPSSNNSRIWFEQNGNSPMLIAGGGTPSDLRLGIALNPNGTEIPTAKLQVGGTGTTGTFRYIDSNQSNGYVLTSDNLGNATWQPNSGFTGNTSGDCITDLYVSNIYGCSPVTFHDSIQTTGSTSTGLLSFAFGDNVTASGDYSHAEGSNTIASGDYSHAEGFNTSATTFFSHAEGRKTISSGEASHAEGRDTIASGNHSHAEGRYTIASGNHSHTQGNWTVASGNASHAGGIGFDQFGRLTANGEASFAHFLVNQSPSNFGVYGDHSAILGGLNHIIEANAHQSAILGGSGNTISSGTTNSVVLGGVNITATTNNTTYVDKLNINTLGTGTTISNLGIDANGFVVSGVTSSFTGDTNFANTNLTFDFSREHNLTENYYLQITSDNGAYNEAYLFMAGSDAGPGRIRPSVYFGYGSNYYEAGDIYSILTSGDNNIQGSNFVSIMGNSISGPGSGINADILIGSGATQTNQFRDTRPTIISSKNSTVSSGITNSVIVGGEKITATESNTAYVDKLNIKTLGTGTSVNNLGIDANGFVVTGVTSSFTGNTSGDCITDLYVSNLYGCSPITVNDDLLVLSNLETKKGISVGTNYNPTGNTITTSDNYIRYNLTGDTIVNLPSTAGSTPTPKEGQILNIIKLGSHKLRLETSVPHAIQGAPDGKTPTPFTSGNSLDLLSANTVSVTLIYDGGLDSWVVMSCSNYNQIEYQATL